MGLCIWNSAAIFYKARTDWIQAFMSVAESEAWGLLQGLKWAQDLRLPVVILSWVANK